MSKRATSDDAASAPRPHPTAPRTSEAEGAARERQLAEWIVQGYGGAALRDLACETWGVSRSTFFKIQRRVLDRMREADKRAFEDLVVEHVQRRENIYRRLIGVADTALARPKGPDLKAATEALGAARACLTDLARLQALYATDRGTLARAGLDKQLAERLGARAAAESIELLRSAYDETARRGVASPNLGAPAAPKRTPEPDPDDEDADDDYDGGLDDEDDEEE